MSKFATLLLALFVAQKEVIQVDTRLVEVNVVARDKGGPAGNLTPEDLVLVLDPPPVATEAGVDPQPLRSSAGFANGISSISSINQATATADTFEFIARHLAGLPGRKNLI